VSTPRRVHTKGEQEGPCPVCGGTGDYIPDGRYGGGWTGSDYPGFTHAVCWNERAAAERDPDWRQGDHYVSPGLSQKGLGL
jgi:hypothetical protein